MKLDFDLSTYLGKIKKSSTNFHTFINRDSLAVGILVLQPGEQDTQEPHQSDEVYFIISGVGFLKIQNKDYKISKDKLFFVAKNIKHQFHGNTIELKVLYFFGGADT